MQETPQRRRFARRGQIILTLALVIVLLLAGLLYSQRYQMSQFVRALTVPPTQSVHITPLTLPATSTATATPGQASSTDWTMYHADLARSGFVAGMPDPTHLASLWKQPLDGAVYAEPLVVNGEVIAVTENDTLYALDAHSAQTHCHTPPGKPAPLPDFP